MSLPRTVLVEEQLRSETSSSLQRDGVREKGCGSVVFPGLPVSSPCSNQSSEILTLFTTTAFGCFQTPTAPEPHSTRQASRHYRSWNTGTMGIEKFRLEETGCRALVSVSGVEAGDLSACQQPVRNAGRARAGVYQSDCDSSKWSQSARLGFSACSGSLYRSISGTARQTTGALHGAYPPKKGLQHLIEGWARVQDRLKDWHLVIAGRMMDFCRPL